MTRVALLVVLALTLGLPAGAVAGPSAGGLASDGVEWVRNIPLHTDSAGARLHEGYFYITTGRDLFIYDTKEADNPTMVGRMVLPDPGTPTMAEEDPDTNGRILLISNGGTTSVIDVADKTAPKLLSQLEGVDEHTLSCILDCTWAYGSEGAIVDLRDPANPKEAGNWNSIFATSSNHDVTEVAPGLVLTASYPMMLLDARFGPANPKLLAKGTTDPETFIHAVRWPQMSQDDLILAGGEAFGPACADSGDAKFMTWNSIGWQQSGKFSPIAEYHLANGTYTDGKNLTQTWCTHWFMEHPTFSNGGLVALAWYEQGIRFLKVGHEGAIEEAGWFLPHGGQTSAVYWINEEVMYTADYYRGLDVLRWTGPVPRGPSVEEDHNHRPQPTNAKPSDPPRGEVRFTDVVKLPGCVRKGRLKVSFKRGHTVTRATAWIEGRRVLKAKGKRLTSIKLSRIEKKRQTLTISVTTSDSRTLSGNIRIKACRK
jgi:hypothetical protein